MKSVVMPNLSDPSITSRLGNEADSYILNKVKPVPPIWLKTGKNESVIAPSKKTVKAPHSIFFTGDPGRRSSSMYSGDDAQHTVVKLGKSNIASTPTCKIDCPPMLFKITGFYTGNRKTCY